MKKQLRFVSLIAVSMAFVCSRAGDAVHADNTSRWTKTEIPLTVYHDKIGNYETIRASGFWKATSSNKDKQLVFPIAVKISCERAEKTCREADAAVQLGILQSDLLEYDVSSWTAAGVEADDSDEGECGIGHRLAIDFKANSITLTDYPKKVTNDSKCKASQDASSYALQGGQIMLYPPAPWDPLEKKSN